MSLKKLIQNKWHKLTQFISTSSVTFFAALIADIEKSGGVLLQNAALEAVKAAEKTGGSGSDKFAAAFASVVATLTAQGIPIITHAVNGAIEAAVAQLKAS